MARNIDESRNTDAQILASLRRPDAAARDRDEPRRNDRPDVPESDAEVDSADAVARAAALRRLVDSDAPKEPMSSLSRTLRDLRSELEDDVSSAYAAAGVREATLEQETASASSADDAPSRPDFSSPAEIVKAPSNEPLPNLVETKNEREQKRAPRPEPRRVEDEASNVVVVSDLRKGYVKGKKLIPVLRGINLNVRRGEFMAVVGQSGSGKSTLLHLMGTLDTPDSGTIHFEGQRIDNLPINLRDKLRNHDIGMIFQFYHLLPELTTLENVLAPLMIRDSFFTYLGNKAKYKARAKELLELVGLSHRLKHRPNELSGGEMQRASIARALITEPSLLLADEPTGNLDSKASIGVLDLLRKLNLEKKVSIVMVTHDMGQAKDADRAVRIVDGRVVDES